MAELNENVNESVFNESVDANVDANIANEISNAPVIESSANTSLDTPSFQQEIKGPFTGVTEYSLRFDNNFVNEDSFDGAVQLAIDQQPKFDDQPFLDNLEAHAIDMSKYPMQLTNANLNAPIPSMQGSTFNPYETSTGSFDLSTAEGRKSYLAAGQNITAAFAEPNPTPEYTHPLSYNARKYELDRYYNHPRFKDLGFHPFANNDSYYNLHSSKWDNFTRSRAAFSTLFGDAFTSNYRAISDFFTGDNALSDMQGAQAMEDAMRIGRSSSGGTRAFFNDLFVNSAYTMGIVSNILVEEAVLLGATALSGGGLGGGATARTAFNFKRGVDAVKRMFTAKTYTTAATNLMTKLKSLDNATAWYNAAKAGTLATGNLMGRMLTPQTLQGLRRISQSAKAGENLTQLAKASILLGDFYRDVRNVNLAWAESKMEGGLVEMEMRDKLYADIFKYNNNNAPSMEQLNMISADARQAAFTTQMINFPIIFFSNKLVLGTAMRGFQPLAKQIQNSLSGPFGRIFFQGGKTGFKDLGEDWLIGNVFRRMYQAGVGGTLKHAAAAGLTYSTANFAEGVQELAQEATAKGVTAYYDGLYSLDMSADLDMQLADMTENYHNARRTFLGTDILHRNPAVDINEAIKRGVGSQMSGEGFKVFMSGFLMGGMVQGPQRFLFNTVPNVFKKGYSKYMKDGKWDEFVAEKNAAVEKAVRVLNDIYADPAKFFDKTKLNALQQKAFNQAMFDSADVTDIMSFFDSQDNAIFGALETAASLGKMGHFRDMLADMKKMDDKTLKEAFKDSAPNSKAETLRKRLNKFEDRAKEVQENYDQFNSEFVNPFNPSRFDKGSREYQEEVIKAAAFNHARMMALYTKNTFETSLIRSKDIYEKLSNIDALKSLNALDIDILTDPTKLVKELALLEEESKREGTTKKERELIADKKKRFELLSIIQEILDNPENAIVSEGLAFQDIVGIDEEGRPVFGAKGKPGATRTVGRFDRRKIKSSGLEKAMIDYIAYVADTKGELLEGKDLRKTIIDIIDHSYLKGRAGDYYRAHMTIMNPEYMNEYIDRIASIMGDVYKKYTDKNNQTLRLKRYTDKRIRIQWLQTLAEEDGVQPDPDETILFLERGIIPTQYYTEEGQVTQLSDPALFKRIMSRIEDLKKSQSVETAESKDAKRETTQAEATQEEDTSAEPDFESVVGRSKYQQFYKKDKNTQEIIDKLYAQYKASYTVNDGPFMSLNQWAASAQGGKNIIKSRYELDQYYQNDENIDKTKFPTMDDWLKANQRNPLIVGTNGILTKNDVDYSDVSPEFAGKGTIAKDKLDATEEVVVSDDTLGINLIKTTTVNEEGKPEVVYTIVDGKGNNLYNKFKSLDQDGKYISEGYALLPKETTKNLEKRARKAFSWYKNNISKSGSFTFNGIEFNSNDIIEDTSGNKYLIRSTPKMVSKFKNLFLVPVNNANKKKGEDGRRYITEADYTKEGFKKVKEEDVDLVGSLTTKVSQFQPITIIPFNGIKVRPGFFLHGKFDDINYEQDDLFAQLLRTIPVDSTENLELLIERNPDYLEDQSNSKKFSKTAGYTENNQLKYGQNKYQITIIYQGKPVGIMAGLTNTLLFDTDGTRIDGTKITAEQAEKLFIKNRGQSAEELAASVRRNYTKALLITQELEKVLGNKENAQVDIKDLNNVELNITPGYHGWRVNANGNPVLKGGKTASTPYEDLESNTFSTENGSYTIIYDTRKDEKGVRRATLVPSKNLEPGSREEQDIQLKIFNQLQKDGFNNIGELGMGRYVQFVTMPNGTIAYFEIKLDAISTEDGKQIVTDIKGIQEELLSEVKDDNGKFKTKTDKFNPEEVGDQASAKLKELNFYIQTGAPGTNVFMRFNKRGGLEITVKNNDITITEYLNIEDLNEISDLNGLATIINNRINKSKDAKGAKFKIKLNDQSFVPNLPRNLSDVSDLEGIGLSANIIPSLRWGQMVDLNYTNEDRIKQSMNNINAVNDVDTTSETVDADDNAPQPTTQEIYNDLLENDFENIPEEIIEGIRQKINDVGFDELTQIEKDIAEAYKEKSGIDLALATETSTIEGALEKDEDGVQAEYGNEDLARKIINKEKELKLLKQRLINKFTEKFKKENPGQTKGQYRLQARNAAKNSIGVEKLENEIKKLKEGLIGKITLDNFDGRNVEEINEFIKWANDNLPDYVRIKSIEDLGRRLISKGITLGAFAIEVGKISKGIKGLTGSVYVGKQTGFRYHEAFHAVFRMMLTEAEIKRYLRSASDQVRRLMNAGGYEIDNNTFVTSMAEAREYMRTLSQTYSDMTNEELNDVIHEEYLADQFEAFKADPQGAIVDPEVKSFFQRVIDFIKDLFLSYSKGDLQGLFNDIDSGKYRSAPIQNNRFTVSALDSAVLEQTGASTSMAFAIRKGDPIPKTRLLPRSEDSKIYHINNYFTQQETELVVGTITARFFEAQEELTKAKDFDGKYNPNELLLRIIDEYIEEQNPAREENGELIYAETLSDPQLDLLEERYEGLKTYKQDVKKSVSDFLNLFDTQIEDAEIILDRNTAALDTSLKNDEDFEASANEIGGSKSLSKGIRIFFATRFKSIKDPVTEKQVLAPVNYVNIYNTFMKALAGITDPNQMLARLKYFENENDDTRAAIGDLFAKFNLSDKSVEDFVAGNYNAEQIRSQGFFQSILKGFTQLRSDYYQLEVDQDAGVVNIFKSTSRDDASTQIDNWQDHYSVLVNKLNDDQSTRNAASAVLGRIEFYSNKDSVTNAELEKVSREISDALFNKLGMKLAPATVKFIILNEGVPNKTAEQRKFVKLFAPNTSTLFGIEDVQEIKSAVDAHGRTKDNRAKANLYYDMTEEDIDDNDNESSTGTDVKFRIKKLAQLNAIFDSTVGSTVFRNAEGKLIYAHQMPTYNLEKVAELNTEDALDEMLTNPFMTTNAMLTDPRFRDLVVSGKLRVARMGGVKYTSLEADDNGNYKANNKLGASDNNKSFGSVSGREFQALAINLYLSAFNNATGEVTESEYIDEDGKTKKYVTSLNNLTVISESNTADFVPLPVLMTVEYKAGKSTVTQETIDKFEDAVIKAELERINRERFQKQGYTEDEILGYNDSDSGRAYRLYNGKNLLSKSKTVVKKLNALGVNQSVGVPASVRSNIENLEEGSQQLIIMKPATVAKLNLRTGTDVYGSINTVGDKTLSDEKYIFTNIGVIDSSDYTITQLQKLLGNDMTNVKTNNNKYKVTLGDVDYFTRTKALQNWLKGSTTENIVLVEKPTAATEAMFEITGAVEVTDQTPTEQKDINDQVIDLLEKAANESEDFTYEEAKAQIEADLGVNVRDLILERLNQEFEEHLTILQNNKTLEFVDQRLISVLKTSKGQTKGNAAKSASKLNLIANNPDNHNLKQIFYNDWLNRTLFKQVLLQDPSRLFKDSVDEIKRAKALNAAGPSAQSFISAPYVFREDGSIKSGLGINHAVNHISLITFEDIDVPARFGRTATDDKPVTSTDAQMYYTSKAFRYLMFGIGSLTSAQARIMDKVDAGENISLSEFYGAGVNEAGYKALGGIMNSKKFVYFDGEVFLKMSAFVLSKRLTSDPETNFETALPDAVELHNLRVAMESVEEKGIDTISVALPASASKAAKKNVVPKEVILNPGFNLNDDAQYDDFLNSGYVTDLSAKYMRLQQITPSNKGTISDPTQIKQLITSEQDNSLRVRVGNQEMSLGDVRALYNKTIGDRVEIKYLQRRNLIFDYQKAQDELQDSIELGEVTVDLSAFLKYAQSALAASAASPQFMELFELDETGAQKYDLNNPITQNKFQQLFLAFFSKGELSERVNGESFALVSNFGKKFYKKVLAIDPETGQPTRWEVIRREDYLKNREELAKTDYDNKDERTFSGLKVGDIYLDELRMNVKEYDKDGNETGIVYSETAMPAWDPRLSKIKSGEALPDVISKMFGVRIPSQDKHSAINLKVVDFLPVEYGSSAMFPTELVEISGADFDIDKLYTHMKEFYMKDGEFIEYGATENVNQQYQEYLDYMIADAKKKGTSMNYALDLWKSRGRITDPATVDDLSLPSEGIVGALKILGLPVTKQEFEQYKNKFNRLPYTAAQSNQALDLKYVLLGNNSMTEGRFDRPVGVAYEPAVLDPIIEVANELLGTKETEALLPELAELTREDGVIIESPVGMYRSWVNNKAGAGAIGAAVLPNIIVNILKEYNVSLRSQNVREELIRGGNIEINGYKYRSFKGDYIMDPTTGRPIISGDRKQFIISALVTAATDNAKERLLGKLGLNRNALGITVGLVSLGVDLKTAILLVNQPTVRDIYARAEAGEGTVGRLLANEINDLEALNDDAKKLAFETQVTTDLLVDEIQSPEAVDNIEKLSILYLFRNAYSLSNKLQTLQVLSTNTSFDFSSIDDISKAFNDMTDVGVFMNDKTFEKDTTIPFDVRFLFKKDKTFQGRYAAILENLKQSMPAIFVTMSPTFEKFRNVTKENIPYIETSKADKNLLSFFIIKAYMKALNDKGLAELAVSLNNGFIYDEFAGKITINSVIDNIRNVLKQEQKSNAFMEFVAKVDTKNPVNKAMINMVKGKTWTSLNSAQITNLQNGLRDLYAMPQLRKDVRHLIHYLILKDGLTYARDTFIDIIPVPLLDDILNVSGNVTDLFNNENISDGQFVSLFGETRDGLLREWIEGYSNSRGNIYFLQNVRRKIGRQITSQVIPFKKGKAVKRNAKSILLQQQEDLTWTIEMNANHKESFSKKEKRKKGKYQNIEYVVDKRRDRNTKNITRAINAQTKTIQVRDKNIEVIGFPQEIKMDVSTAKQTPGSRTKKDVRTFVLKYLYTPKEFGNYSDTINFAEENIAYGLKAVYEEIKTEGSMQQYDAGFIHGDRSTYEYLQEKKENRDSAVNTNESAMNKTAAAASKDPLGMGMKGVVTAATNDSVTFTVSKDDLKKIMVETKQDKEKSKLEKIQEMSENNTEQLNENINTDTAGNSIKVQVKEDPNADYSTIENAWNDLTSEEKKAIGDNQNVTSAESAIARYKITNSVVPVTQEEFMERLKKCK